MLLITFTRPLSNIKKRVRVSPVEAQLDANDAHIINANEKVMHKTIHRKEMQVELMTIPVQFKISQS
jgi:hypothetical protein